MRELEPLTAPALKNIFLLTSKNIFLAVKSHAHGRILLGIWFSSILYGSCQLAVPYMLYKQNHDVVINKLVIARSYIPNYGILITRIMLSLITHH
jgi:hypothetical protein